MIMNAFEMITLSQGLNLSALFDRHEVLHIWDQLILHTVASESQMNHP